MLSYLLDEHISAVVARQVAAHRPEIPIHSLHDWRGGRLLRASDDEILHAAREEGLTLVTYDLSTIPDLLTRFAADGIAHAGVIFIDQRTILPRNFGGLVRALTACWDARREWDWTNRVYFLAPGPGGA